MSKTKSWYHQLLAVNLKNITLKKGVLFIKIVDVSQGEIDDVVKRLVSEKRVNISIQSPLTKPNILQFGEPFSQSRKIALLRTLIQYLPRNAVLLYSINTLSEFTTNHRSVLSSPECSDMDTVKWQCHGVTVPPSVWEQDEPVHMSGTPPTLP